LEACLLYLEAGSFLKSRRGVVSATTNQVFADYQNDFEGLIPRYSPVLFRVALRRLRNVEDAEDAVQDALLSAYKHIGQFEGRSQLSTWLTRIVTNVSLMKLRRCSRHEMLSLDQNHENDGSVLASELMDVRPNPETICAQAEMDETVRQALRELSPKQRSAIQMCDLEGFSTREAANALGISTNTLKSRVSRARATLSLLLGEVIGTRPAGKAAPFVERKSVVRLTRSSSEHSEASAAAAEPLGSKICVSKPSLVPVCGHSEIHNHAKVHIERAENCYPPHSLENTTHPPSARLRDVAGKTERVNVC
jgi:RNA polymerase sigma-70 factor (ECF subfamily)